MVAPMALAAIAAAISAAAQGGTAYFGKKQQERNTKRKTKEMKRETYASLLNDAMQRNAELEGHRLSSRAKLGKASSNNSVNSSALLREAFNI